MGLVAFSLVIDAFHNVVASTLTIKLGRQLRSDLQDKLNKIPLSYYDKNTTGNTLSIITNECSTIAENFYTSILYLINPMLYLIGLIIGMLIMS
jgi:ATP-binding cassette subfamily B protein